MTQIQPRLTRIYKSLFVTLCAFVLCGSTLCCSYAIEFGSVKYDDNYIDYSKFNKKAVRMIADKYFKDALKTDDSDMKTALLQSAAGEYFILSKVCPNDLYPLIQLARVYDYENKNSYSKAYFYRALDIDKNDPETNFYFGDYYYARDEYKKALNYYNISFQNGYKENYDVLIKMATMYEKLGDLLRANQYYKKAFLVKHTDDDIADKIRMLEDLHYKNTGYYNKKRKKM